MRGKLLLWVGESNHSFSEIKSTSSDIVPAKGCVEDNPERSEGFLLPYESLWAPIISMRGKFPIGIHYLNGFLQASMLHLFKPSACPLRFASGTHLFFPQCRHGLATSSQTVSVGHERNEQPKGKPRTSWRLLRRLIGESRDPCRFVSYGTLAGCQFSNRACLANPINLLFVEP
jgi:hypothetical protein